MKNEKGKRLIRMKTRPSARTTSSPTDRIIIIVITIIHVIVYTASSFSQLQQKTAFDKLALYMCSVRVSLLLAPDPIDLAGERETRTPVHTTHISFSCHPDTRTQQLTLDHDIGIPSVGLDVSICVDPVQCLGFHSVGRQFVYGTSVWRVL